MGDSIQIARAQTRIDLEEGFLSILKDVVSNDPEQDSGAAIFERHVRPNITRFPEGLFIEVMAVITSGDAEK